jgi:seryl-tRNA synthetase
MSKPKLSAKDYLSQAYRIDQRINSKIEQVQSLRELAEKATATLSDVPPSKGSRNIHRMEDVIAKMVDLESEINADLTRLINLKHEIVTVIKCVENPELQTLLELRYLCFKTWEQIAVELHFDLRWVYRLHGRALDGIDAIRHC